MLTVAVLSPECSSLDPLFDLSDSGIHCGMIWIIVRASSRPTDNAYLCHPIVKCCILANNFLKMQTFHVLLKKEDLLNLRYKFQNQMHQHKYDN